MNEKIFKLQNGKGGLFLRYFIILLACLSFLWMTKVLFLDTYPDFTSYYWGPKHVIDGENPYKPDTRYFTPQVYPPFNMIFFIPRQYPNLLFFINFNTILTFTFFTDFKNGAGFSAGAAFIRIRAFRLTFSSTTHFV